jgi:hypothetical protein
MLELLQIGVIVFPGMGIQNNLAESACVCQRARFALCGATIRDCCRRFARKHASDGSD